MVALQSTGVSRQQRASDWPRDAPTAGTDTQRLCGNAGGARLKADWRRVTRAGTVDKTAGSGGSGCGGCCAVSWLSAERSLARCADADGDGKPMLAQQTALVSQARNAVPRRSTTAKTSRVR